MNYLDGLPRVHYDNLQRVEDESCDGEHIIYDGDAPFTGVAWYELHGKRTEHTLVDGIQNGRCIEVYPDGTLAEEGFYKNGDPIGQKKTWHESGAISSLCEYDEDAKLLYKKNYNATGVLVKEVLEKPHWRLSFWTDQGSLIYRSEHKVTKYYSENGSCVITLDDTGKAEPVYDDQELFKYAFTMLAAKVDIVKYAIYDWLFKRLDEDNADARSLSFSLLDHPVVGVVEDALFRIEYRNYREAIPLVLNLTLSKKKRAKNEGGFIGTTSELAERVLKKLMVDADVFTRNKIAKHLELRTNIRIQLAKRKAVQERKCLRVKQNWPITEALYNNESYVGESTTKSGDQIFTNEVMHRSIDQIYVYEYVINDRTYRAVFSCKDPVPEKKKMLRYRAKNPVEYIFYDAQF